MKNVATTLLLCAMTLLGTSTSSADQISSTDLWDISQGGMVTGNSSVLSFSDARDMFGGEFSTLETNRTLFADRPGGTVHWVEWQTSVPVKLNAYNLVAMADGDFPDVRAFSQFSLYAWDGASWDLLDEIFPSDPYGGGATYTSPHSLEVFRTFTTVTAQDFRAEFVQRADSLGRNWGPRINELDGYLTIPEPAACLVFGIVFISSLARRNRLSH